MYTNARSIVKPNKLEEIQCIMQSLKNPLDVIVVTDTWIKSNDEAKRLQITGYAHYFNHRTNMRGGGVSIFIRKDLNHYLIEEKCLNDNNYLWIHLKNYSLDIGAIYRKPTLKNVKTFLETYSNQLHNRMRGIVFGDINLNLLSKVLY